MKIKCFKVGWLSTNCYVLSCEETNETAIIDPGMETKTEIDKIMEFINKNNLKVRYIINTHSHPDHISANEILKKATDASILIHEKNYEGANADRKLQEGEVIKIGNHELGILYTPGHTPDGISLVGENFVFTGDTLFRGSIGRTDFPGGSFHEIIHSIKTKLLPLPDNTVVYPGHESSTTIGDEKKHNPFLQM